MLSQCRTPDARSRSALSGNCPLCDRWLTGLKNLCDPCFCGAVYHQECLMSLQAIQCPTCRSPFAVENIKLGNMVCRKFYPSSYSPTGVSTLDTYMDVDLSSNEAEVRHDICQIIHTKLSQQHPHLSPEMLRKITIWVENELFKFSPNIDAYGDVTTIRARIQESCKLLQEQNSNWLNGHVAEPPMTSTMNMCTHFSAPIFIPPENRPAMVAPALLLPSPQETNIRDDMTNFIFELLQRSRPEISREIVYRNSQLIENQLFLGAENDLDKYRDPSTLRNRIINIIKIGSRIRAKANYTPKSQTSSTICNP